MRTVALTIALFMSSAAVAQTMTDTEMDATTDTTVQTDSLSDADTTVDTTVDTSVDTGVTAPTQVTSPVMPVTPTPASAAVVQPSNADPEHDARGIAVISAPAVVPAGFNGVSGTAMGGPLVDPATGQTVDTADSNYPACTATVTDNCLQTYERNRS
jgi:hypothetical protein